MHWSHIVLSVGVCKIPRSVLLSSARTLATQLTGNAGEDEGERELTLLVRLQTGPDTLEICVENSPQN